MKRCTLEHFRSRCRILSGSLLVCVLALALSHGVQTPSTDSDLIAHEWGTFTSIAGSDGRAVEWAPLTGSFLSSSTNDLPGFVEHFSYVGFKIGLRGTVRMETPVIYFYSPRNVDLSVHVALSQGLITEWYPHAGSVVPAGNPASPFLSQNKVDGTISWNAVHVEPEAASNFAQESTESHYYAARETSASPVRVNGPKGDQQEKFLFYRGVSSFSVPVSTKLTEDGQLDVTNLRPQEIPALVLFERRGEKVGYRLRSNLQNEVVLDPPPLTANINSLYSDLEQILETSGLYQDEAHAMVRTWQNSWFEEGARLFYIVPRSFVDEVLPLNINPVPANTVRVFVGRMEIVTAATRQAVAAAMASNDQATLNKYSRFLEPILQIIEEKNPANMNRLPGSKNKESRR